MNFQFLFFWGDWIENNNLHSLINNLVKFQFLFKHLYFCFRITPSFNYFIFLMHQTCWVFNCLYREKPDWFMLALIKKKVFLKFYVSLWLGLFHWFMHLLKSFSINVVHLIVWFWKRKMMPGFSNGNWLFVNARWLSTGKYSIICDASGQKICIVGSTYRQHRPLDQTFSLVNCNWP